MIRAIDRSSVQKICSGQVVVDLATAVKEMVENSLDSGATLVEVRLSGMGADSIEVSDNGSGIDPSNYPGIAMKHFTSKLQVFEDIYSVSSFGFRGEALNALCELSEKFTVTTRQDSQPTGTQLSFDHNGRLLSQTVAARTKGTTVTVEKLFAKLPVRRNEFLKSIKKHFQKMVRVVQSYALISLGVKIVVSNTNEAGVKQTVLTTQSGGRLSDNVSILFGAKFAASLLPLDVTVQLPVRQRNTRGYNNDQNSRHKEEGVDGVNSDQEDQEEPGPAGEVCSAFSTGRGDRAVHDSPEAEDEDRADSIEGGPSSPGEQVSVKVTGLVSKAGLGVGRSDNDRQFAFLNGRPVDLPRFAKVLNEVWRRYEMKQKPAFVLNITVPPGYFDVNLTPDKREVLIVQEALILEKLREGVDALYMPVRSTMQLNQGMGEAKLSSLWPVLPTTSTAATVTPGALDETAAAGPEGGPEQEEKVSVAVSAPADMREHAVPSSGNAMGFVASPERLLARAISLRSPPPPIVWATQQDRERLLFSPQRSSPARPSISTEQSSSSAIKRKLSDEHTVGDDSDLCNARLATQVSQDELPAPTATQVGTPSQQQGDVASVEQPTFVRRALPLTVDFLEALKSGRPEPALKVVDTVNASLVAAPALATADSDGFDIEGNAPVDAFQSSEVADRTAARVLSKKDFPRMRVVGQFNLGFIITELDGDLYILDQHACDEKYRFELLQRTTQIHQQPLIHPLTVETSAALELVIAEHVDVFAQNGFKIGIDAAAPSGSRVKLLAVPFSKSVHFGVDDVNELASMIADRTSGGGEYSGTDSTAERVTKTYLALKNDAVSDSSSSSSGGKGNSQTAPRLPKLVAMYASRACRSAIMIGTAMRPQEMSRVLAQLEGVEQPWNCPHGRPTLRHLVDLQPLREMKRRKMGWS